MRFSFLLLLQMLAGLLLTHTVVAQNNIPWHCADEELTTLQRQLYPAYNATEDRNNLLLKEYMGTMLKCRRKPVFRSDARMMDDSTNYTIPVVVHVVHPAGEPYGTGTNVSYAQIRSQIEALNAAFGRNYPAYNGQTHPAYAQDTHIRFCLARLPADTVHWANGPGGVEYGVVRYNDNTGAYNHNITVTSANQLLSVTHPNSNRFPFAQYFNIWLVKTIGGGDNVMGYAPRPINAAYPLDGVVMRADIFGDNTTGNLFLNNNFGLSQGKILAHETGHYLNLYHIFQWGCAGANAAGAATDACDLNGDMICDIEPATTQNIWCNTTIPNTCTANYATGTTTLDMINDYMSYADDDCMNTFTLNQAQRMWATLQLQRKTLWQTTNLVSTGVLGANACVPPYLNVQINTNDAVFCAGKPIVFSNPTAGNTATAWQWQFPSGSIATATTSTATVTYNTPGSYKAFLQVSSGSTIRRDSLLFTVLDCKLNSSMLYMANWYFGKFCSVSFSSGAPVQTNTALANNTMQGESSYAGQLAYVGATVSLSDSVGNLLFYSNAVSVWNKNHQKITTSSIFGTSDINASTGVCYIPYPGQPGKYFIAGVYPNFDGGASGVRFVLVDLLANTVTPYQEFQHPSLPNRFSQYLTVVPHCNGTDYWIITKGAGWSGDTRFYSFLVTGTGIDKNQAPVISAGFQQLGYGGSGYQLKANRKGDKLIMTSPPVNTNAAGALYDFDSRTGTISNERLIPNATGYNNIQTGTAFSPNGEYFYLMRSSNLATNGLPYWLFQYRVSDMQYNIIDAPGFHFGSAFQPGPDNQIYVSTQANELSRINNPDQWGGVSVNGYAITFPPVGSGVGNRTLTSIPAFIDARRPEPAHPDFDTKLISCNTYRFTSLCFDNYTATWDAGDGAPLQMGSNITHQYTRTGTFTVKLSLSRNGATVGTTSKQVMVLPLSVAVAGPTNVCSNSQYPTQYFSPVLLGVNYRWQVDYGSIVGPNTLPFVDVSWFSVSNTGRVLLEVRRDSCVLSDALDVVITKGVAINWQLKDSVCTYDSSLLLAASPAGGKYSGLGVSGNRFSPAAAGVGNHTIAYDYYNESNCPGHVEKTVRVRTCNVPIDAGSSCTDVLNNVQITSNPVRNEIQFKSTYVLSLVQVYNSIGQRVAAGIPVNSRFQLPVLAAGVYFLRIHCPGSSVSKTFRFLKVN